METRLLCRSRDKATVVSETNMVLVRSLQAVEPAILRESLPECQCAVEEPLRGRDSFISLTTGYGKYLIRISGSACLHERDSFAYSRDSTQ